jgi:hypothetical protein
MKTHLEKIPEMTIEEYAEANDLEMVVRERETRLDADDRFYASFRNADVRGDHVLIGVFGNGNTPEEAIFNNAHKLDLKTLVVDWHEDKKRREIKPVRIVAHKELNKPTK